jgi:hypothetical protein
MEVHVTAEAVELVRRKGGVVALDFIRAVG